MTVELGKLYTWVDVQDALVVSRVFNPWPEFVISISTYWDSLKITVSSNYAESDGEQIASWLNDVFGLRFRLDLLGIELQSLTEAKILPIEIERSDNSLNLPRPSLMRPTFARPGRIWRSVMHAHPKPWPEHMPPVIAFHSFKGGVGRTTHAIALAFALQRKAQQPILLIDADLEAPGLTFPFMDRFPVPEPLPISSRCCMVMSHKGDRIRLH
jgi:AAA domain